MSSSTFQAGLLVTTQVVLLKYVGIIIFSAQDEAGLLMQLDAIQGTGTIIIISNLRRNSAHQLELDFDADASDIRIAADLPEAGSSSPVPNYQQSRATQPKEVSMVCAPRTLASGWHPIWLCCE